MKTTKELDYLVKKIDNMFDDTGYTISESDKLLVKLYWDELKDHFDGYDMVFSQDERKIMKRSLLFESKSISNTDIDILAVRRS